MTETERAAFIAQLNDTHRCRVNKAWIFTPGVQALDVAALAEAVAAVCGFNAWTADNDPHGERDFGTVEIDDHRLFWKIDYYDLDLGGASPDPADPAVTKRVLTLMLAEEY